MDESFRNNPFTPNFGQVPMHMAGRSFLLEEMKRAFESPVRDPNLSTILIGARGTGKTALLSCLASEAEQRGWISVSTTAFPGMLEDVFEQALRRGAEFLDGKDAPRLKGVSVGQAFGLEWENQPERTLNWRSRMTDVLEAFAEHDVGLLITVDEVEPRLDEMIQLVAVYQHFVREDRKVALLMAGLPHKVSGLISGKSTSFLRRACQHRLARIEDYEVESAFRQTVEFSQKKIGDKALERAAKAIKGFPFMMQLVGFRSWQFSGERESVSLEDIEQGAAMAENDMKMRVLRPTLDDLSERDLEFLGAMLVDPGSSTPADIATRLGRSASHVSTYKRRLLDQGVIQQSGRSKVEFALPMLREYLPEYLESCL
ncbi:MAG: AAA family ATPase [Eggerthellaceae bacterium]|nr:AAA family ATPase [Eggerthellaceae bacterium]